MINTAIIRAPVMRAGMRTSNVQTSSVQMMQKRFAQLDNRGGKSKLIFRTGLKDVPVELYPIGFVVGAGIVGATIAIGRHLWNDGLRKGPTPQ